MADTGNMHRGAQGGTWASHHSHAMDNVAPLAERLDGGKK